MAKKSNNRKGNKDNLKKGDKHGNKKGLNAKQKAFCEYYIQTNNASESARLAGYATKSCGAIGSENLKKPQIKEYIEKRLNENQEKLIMKSDEVLINLTKVARREESEHVVVTTIEKRETWVEINGELKKVVTQTEVPVIVEIPAKLSDTNKALELLGKKHKLFTDKVEQDIDMEFNVNVEYVKPEQNKEGE